MQERCGENLARTFMNDFPLPGMLLVVIMGQDVGATGISVADGEKCPPAAIDEVFN
jgi:hypothetical protein